MNRVFLSQWIELHRGFSWLVDTQEIWIIALLAIKLWITRIGVFLTDVSAFYRPIHTIEWKTHNLTHRRFFCDDDDDDDNMKDMNTGCSNKFCNQSLVMTLYCDLAYARYLYRVFQQVILPITSWWLISVIGCM